MDPQGSLSLTVHVTPTRTDLLPQNPAPVDAIHRWPGSRHNHRRQAEESGQGRLPEEVAFPTSQIASVH